MYLISLITLIFVASLTVQAETFCRTCTKCTEGYFKDFTYTVCPSSYRCKEEQDPTDVWTLSCVETCVESDTVSCGSPLEIKNDAVSYCQVCDEKPCNFDYGALSSPLVECSSQCKVINDAITKDYTMTCDSCTAGPIKGTNNIVYCTDAFKLRSQ